jgi:hypothetical protein
MTTTNNTPNILKVADYRDLISEVWDCRTSLVSAVTSHEQRSEAMRLRDLVALLKRSACGRASERDLERADNVVRQCELLLGQKEKEFDAADANLCRMAFGGEWR